MGSMEIDYDSLQQQIMDNLTDEDKDKEKLSYIESVMTSIETEVKRQQLEFTVEHIQAQIVYLCALQGKEKESGTFYSDFISCFTGNNDQMFTDITAKFGVTFTDEDKKNILSLYAKAIKSQTVTPSGLHNVIAGMLRNDATPFQQAVFYLLFTVWIIKIASHPAMESVLIPSPQNNKKYLSNIVLSSMKGILQDSENRIVRLLFKLAVEMAMNMNVLAASLDVDEITLTRLQARCVEEVKKTNGSISFEDAAKFQKR